MVGHVVAERGLPRVRGHRLAQLLVGAAVLVAGNARPLSAGQGQPGVLSGTVIDSKSQRPLAEATVAAEGTEISALTGARGEFRLTGLTGSTARLRITRIGYQMVTVEAPVGGAPLVVRLTELVVKLDELVVTGTAGEVQKRSLGTTVARIDATAANEFAAPGSVNKLLAGRAPGVVISENSGRVGAGSEINVRGRSTLSLGEQPLIYLDGARVSNNAGAGTGFQGSAGVSRVNDINPEDIESIEVIKGPAAATLYGTEASNGVIQIITKKGRRGSPEWNVSVQQGAHWVQNPSGRIGNAYGPIDDPASTRPLGYTSINLVDSAAAMGWPLFTRGHLQRYGLTLNGGTERFQYFASGNLDLDKGTDPNSKQDKASGHLNLRVAPNDKIDVNASLNYLSSQLNQPDQEGQSAMFSTLFGGPLFRINVPLARGFYFAPPQIFYQYDPIQNTQDVNKFTGSVQLNHRPTSWFNHRLVLGVDQTAENNTILLPFMGPAVAPYFPGFEKGQIVVTNRDFTYSTLDYSGTARATFGSNLVASTSFGTQLNRLDETIAQLAGQEFPAPGPSTVSATARQQAGHSIFRNTTLGLYGQEQLAWKNRLFLTGAVRIDNNSSFGSDFDLVTYPKASVSWVISEEPFWRLGFVKTLKLRAAFGQSGLQPAALTALRTYSATTGPGGAAAVLPNAVGNPLLKPERGQEIEAGFEANLFDRIGLEVTYFTKRTKDALLSRAIAPSSGFTGVQWVNIGETSNKGIEVAVSAQIVSSRKVAWELGATVATSNDKIVSLGDIGSLGALQRFEEGFPIGGYFPKFVVGATLIPNPNVSNSTPPLLATNLMCDGGTGFRGRERGGQPVPCAGAPQLFAGTPTPKASGAFTSTVTLWGRLQLYAMVDYQVGHYQHNFDRVIRCSIIPTCEAYYFPEKFDPAFVGEVQTGVGNIQVSRFVEKASWAKIREISASYTLPRSWIRVLGASRGVLTVAGRHLHTFTGFTGLDPELHRFSGSSVRSTQAQLPIPATVLTTLRLSF
jgi:TonB-linked SusC/RagA family outer membrane protein